MGQTMRGPLWWGAVGIGLAVSMAAPAVGSAMPKLTASSEVRAIVAMHNAFGGDFQTFYSGTVDQQATQCDELRNTQDADWSSYESDVAQDEGLINDFTEFNKDVLGWIPTLEKFRPNNRQKRKLFAKAIRLLHRAHDEHAEEIFHLSGAVAHLQSHDCDTASSERSAAAAPGRLAWSDEYLALHKFSEALKVKLSELNWPPGESPYDQPPN